MKLDRRSTSKPPRPDKHEILKKLVTNIVPKFSWEFNSYQFFLFSILQRRKRRKSFLQWFFFKDGTSFQSIIENCQIFQRKTIQWWSEYPKFKLWKSNVQLFKLWSEYQTKVDAYWINLQCIMTWILDRYLDVSGNRIPTVICFWKIQNAVNSTMPFQRLQNEVVVY